MVVVKFHLPNGKPVLVSVPSGVVAIEIPEDEDRPALTVNVNTLAMYEFSELYANEKSD